MTKNSNRFSFQKGEKLKCIACGKIAGVFAKDTHYGDLVTQETFCHTVNYQEKEELKCQSCNLETPISTIDRNFIYKD